MNKEIVIGLICLVALLTAVAAKFGYSQHQVAQERVRLAAQKPAMFAARDKAMAEIKKIADTRATDQRAVEGTSASGAGKPADAVKTPGAPGSPNAPSAVAASSPALDDSDIKAFAAHAKITSLLLGDPKIVVIDKREYEEGSEIALPRGRRGRIAVIAEEAVTVNCDGRSYRIVHR